MIVVDDDASIRRALRTQLHILGFNVLVFQSAEEVLACEVAAGDTYLLLDIYIRGISGFGLWRTLAAAERLLPTILMSGREDQQTRQIMCEAKPIASLFKPFEEKALLGAIREGAV